MKPIYALSALEMKDKLEEGDLSSEQLVAAHIERAKVIEPTLNAFVHRFDEEALAHAKRADAMRDRGESMGPLHGLPITIKENIETRGVASTIGLKSRLNMIARDDAPIVKALKDAGAIVLGKTNIPLLLLSHESENSIWGTANNPWDTSRTPGGSSGGEAAAIASGMSPWGVGSDIGGSIRVPAAWTGTVGLKPTIDRWSNQGSVTALLGQEVVRGQLGPMTRTVADCDYLFRAVDSIHQHALDPSVPPVTTKDPSSIQPEGLTVGVFESDGFLTPSSSVQRAVREASDALERAGCQVVRYNPVEVTRLLEVYFGALSSDGGATVKALMGSQEVLPQVKDLLRLVNLPAWVKRALAPLMRSRGEHRVALMLEQVGRKPLEAYWKLTSERSKIRRLVHHDWSEKGLDAVLCPAHATPAVGHRQSGDFTIAGCYSMRYNFLNFAAGVVPVTRVDEGEQQRTLTDNDRLDKKAALIESQTAGLPIGVQIAAPPYREDVVLRLLGLIEAGVKDGPRWPITPVS